MLLCFLLPTHFVLAQLRDESDIEMKGRTKDGRKETGRKSDYLERQEFQEFFAHTQEVFLLF
jgi:hypothetical protein